MKASSAARFGRFVLLSVAVAALAGATARPSVAQSLRYPTTTRGGQADDLNGVRVPDPYRWLENIDAPDVHAWVTAQNALTEGFLAPRRRDIRALVSRAWNYGKTTAPFGGGERLFFYENAGLENQAALYVQDRFDVSPRVLIDANAFSRDGLISLVDEAASPEGRYLAYAVSTHGSSWRVVRIRDVRTGQDLDDELTGVRDSPLSWTKDERGFFYVRVDSGRTPGANALAPHGRQRVFYHRAGRPQSEDQVVYENTEHPSQRLRAEVSEDGHYLVIASRTGTDLHNRLYFIDLDNPKRPNLGAPLVKLFDVPDALYEFVSSQGNVFYLRTTKGAPRARLVGVDVNTPDANYWKTTIRETYDPLVWVKRVDDRFVAHRLHDARSSLELFGLDGSPRGAVQLPGEGTVTELSPRSDMREFYFTYSSFLQPPTVYRYDLDAKNVVIYKETRVDSSLSRFETTQLFFTSKDGTRVPLFITVRRGITLDGSHPTLLTAEGSFNVSMSPVFSPDVAAWLELGGIYAVANVRGGGEYGRAWHDAAAGLRKPVAVDDLLSAADFLINQRYTRSSLLGVTGRGHGAMLAAAAVVKRPELFGAALLDAGVYDMARFSRFTVGPTWVQEYGSPDRPAELKALLGYSPLHNVEAERSYPATLITVGEHDDVVTPIHSYKLAAALQTSQRGPAPILLRVDHDLGFGPGAPTSKLMALHTDRLAFLMNALRGSR
jgi:prolyl oligopeptidase